MTNQDSGRKTLPVPVHGRNVVIRQLVDTQLMLLSRDARILQRDDVDKERKLVVIDRMFKILESAVVEAADREYLEDLMAQGELDLRELLSFVTPFGETEAPIEEKPKVRRGRPPLKRAQ